MKQKYPRGLKKFLKQLAALPGDGYFHRPKVECYTDKDNPDRLTDAIPEITVYGIPANAKEFLKKME